MTPQASAAPHAFSRPFVYSLSTLLCFAALAKGAHDLWAATLVYLCGLVVLTALLIRRTWSESSEGFQIVFPLPLLGILAALTLSFARSIHPSESYLGLMDWGVSILLFLVSVNVFRRDEAVDAFPRLFVPLLWLQCGIALYQKIALPNFFPAFEAPGTLVNPNLEAAFLLLWLPVFASRARRSWDESGPRLFWLSGFAAALASLGMTFSSWGVVCLIAVLPLSLGLDPLKRLFEKSPRKAWMGLAGMALLAVGLLWFKMEKFNLFSSGDARARMWWWESGLAMFFDRPLTGVGIGNFPSAYLAYKVGPVQNTLYVHNWAVGLLAETGFLGSAAILVFAWLFLKRLSRSRPVSFSRWPYAVGLMGFLLFSAVNIGPEYLANLMIFWVFLGIVAADFPLFTWKPRRSVVAAALALPVAAVPFLLSPFLASQNVVLGDIALKEGRVEPAIKLYQSAFALDPRCAEAHRGSALSLFAKFRATRNPADLEQAVLHQKQAIGLDQLSAVLWWELSVYLSEQGKESEALSALRRAHELHESNELITEALRKWESVQPAG